MGTSRVHQHALSNAILSTTRKARAYAPSAEGRTYLRDPLTNNGGVPLSLDPFGNDAVWISLFRHHPLRRVASRRGRRFAEDAEECRAASAGLLLRMGASQGR